MYSSCFVAKRKNMKNYWEQKYEEFMVQSDDAPVMDSANPEDQGCWPQDMEASWSCKKE